MDNMDKLVENYLLKSKLVSCERCNSALFYIGIGQYQCKKCNEVFLDDYGKVRAFLEENGPCSAIVISKATGVDKEFIDILLHRGKLEIPENSKYFIKCERCGGSLRYGRICPSCAKILASQMQQIKLEDVGETPKPRDSSMKGKMRYFGRDK